MRDFPRQTSPIASASPLSNSQTSRFSKRNGGYHLWFRCCGVVTCLLSTTFLVLLQQRLLTDVKLTWSSRIDTTTSTQFLSPSTMARNQFNVRQNRTAAADITITKGFYDIEYEKRQDASFKSKKLSLRFDWTNLTPTMDLTKKIQHLQRDCARPMATFSFRNRFGLGSDLHMYTRAMCNALESSTHRVRTVGNWTWMDRTNCQNSVLGSPMSCYFAHSELNCPGDVSRAVTSPDFDTSNLHSSLSKPNGNIQWQCPSIIGPEGKEDDDMIQVATMEHLFTRVTPLVYEEATRQLNLVFHDQIPEGLITVHIRWGDKVKSYHGKHIRRPEMDKVQIQEYVDAVHEILRRRRRRTDQRENISSNADVYLATEDPAAVEAFEAAMPTGWNLFVDHFLTETQSNRIDEYNGHSKMARQMNGRPGLFALASLLVAMEANDFVLTTRSNWSRLVDELRRSIVDPRCGNCTTMIDLTVK